MHPALFPFSQPKTSHQSSKLHPDPDCAVLCRYPMWHPFPSLFRNNWSCHRHGCRSTLPHPRQHLLVRNSDTATTRTLLDSRCWISFTGPLQPFPPRTLPKLCGRNPGSPNKTTVCRSLMLAVIPGDVGLFEVPPACDDEDPSVNGIVKTRPLGVLCRFVGFDCQVMPVCGALFVCLLGGLGLLRGGWVASKDEPSACNGDGLGSFEREAEDCFPVSPPFAGFSFVLLRRLLFEVSQAGDDEDDEDDEGSSVTGVVGKKRPSGVLCRFVGFDCRVMPVCGALFVCLLGGLGLLRDGWVASKGEPSACNGDGLGSFEREAEDCFPVSPPFAGFSFVLLRRLFV